MTGFYDRYRRGFTFTKAGLATTAFLCVRNAHAEDAAPKATETKQESPIKIERDALHEQDSLENARASVVEHTIARKEDFELHRAQHQRQMEKLQGQPEDSNARKLLGRRVFFPSLVGVGSSQGGLGFFGPSLLSFSASETSSYIAIQPSIGVKFDSGLTVGGYVLFINQTNEVNFNTGAPFGATLKARSTGASIAPSIGYMFPLGQSGLLLWPTASLYAGYTFAKSFQKSQSQGVVRVDEQSTPSASFGAGGDVSLLFPLSSRAYLALTPSFSVRKVLLVDSEDTTLGGRIAAGLGAAF
jgi:ribosomal protein S13